jgi:hypothetical protein
VTATSWSDETRTEPGFGGRALAAVLLSLLVLGSFCLWIGVPVVVLWGLGKVTHDSTDHLVLGLLAVPVAMILFGILLAVLNTCFLRVRGVQLATEDESDWTPRLSGPLDRIVGISAVICLVAFLVWMVFGSGDVGAPGAEAW